MKEFLANTLDGEIPHSLGDEDVSAISIFQRMVQACLISEQNFSLLEEMIVFCSRNDLLQHVDDFRNKNNIFKKVPFGLRNLPRDMVERQAEVNDILSLLSAGNNLVGVVGVRTGDIIGIRGMGGLGKTVLAQAIAWKVAMTRQVIWLDIGQTPDCLALINTLVKALGGSMSFSDISSAQSWIRANTVNKDCLVVLDDVWNVDDAGVFDYLSGKCQLLITTRDSDVVRGLKASALYELQTMAQNKSRALLYQSAQVTDDEKSMFSTRMQAIVVELLEQCRGLPLALSLVGSNLIDSRAEQDWQDVLDDLKDANLEELRSFFPKDSYPYDNLLAAINVSFERLEESHRERFLDFAIFPEDTDIPSDILELFWSSADSGKRTCNARMGRRILTVLEKKSLIQKGPALHGKNSYRVHDLLLDFARGKLRDTITDVQCMFIEALNRKCVNGEWAKFQGNKDYYYQYLPYHLHSSEQYGVLLNLFFDFHWLEQKVKETNLPSLISDFRFLGTDSYEIKLLKSSLMLSADVIEKAPDSIGPQLLGRLLSCADEHPAVKRLLEHIRERCTRKCRLMPLFSCLSEPVGPLIKIFRKHVDKVLALTTSVSSTGTIVISASTDRSVKVHDLETGKELQVLNGHTMAVYCLALSHSGTILASGSYDSTTRLWNMDSYEQLFVLQGDGGFVNALDFSADDRRLFTGSNDGYLRVWLVATGELFSSLPAHNGHIRGLCTTKDGLYVATASLDYTINLWRSDTLEFQGCFIGHIDTVYSIVATGGDKPTLVSGSGDKTVKIWDLKTCKEVRSLCGHQGEIYCVAVSPDTKHVISAGKDLVVRLWCYHTGKLLFNFEGHSQSIRCVSIISDGCKALSGSQDKSFRVWDLDTSAYMKRERIRGHSDDVMDIAITRDGSRCVSSSKDGSLKIWKCETADERYALTGHTKRAISVAISVDDRYVVSLGKDSFIKVWNMESGNETNVIEGDKQARFVCFSPEGELVLIGCKDDRFFMWNWKKYDVPIKCVKLPAFTTMAIACDRNLVYTCGRNSEVCQIDRSSSLQATAISTGPNPNCTSMVILPSGAAVLSGIPTYSVFIYWELSSWREIRYDAGHPDESIVTAIDITSDGKLALSGSSSGTISLVNLESSNVVQTFTKTESGDGIRLLRILRDDNNFVVVNETNTVELRNFDNRSGMVMAQPPFKVNCVTTLGLKYILLGCANGDLLLYDYLVCLDREYNYQAHSESVSQVEGHPSNEYLYFLSGSENGSVKLWYVTKTTPPVWSQMWSRDCIHSHLITALAFVPNSEDVVSGSYGNEVHRINATGIVRTYKYRSYGIAVLRVVGTLLVAACIRGLTAVKWSLNEGHVTKKVHTGAGREQVSRFNHTCDHVASKGSRHSLLFWSLETGRTIHKLRGHTHDIRALAFVPGGQFLLSGSRDKTLKLWNLRSGCLVEEFHFERFVLAIACAPNGIVCVGLQGGQVCFLRLNNL
ncbi:apoptotic protease-activating factor 1-like isoform X2 [Dendronephthya gigantea]|nr:apoptotic protease-activating factor 1-like isoform X2 [Dendronephthya gigantea]